MEDCLGHVCINVILVANMISDVLDDIEQEAINLKAKKGK